MRFLILCLPVLLIAQICRAQVFGGSPPSVKWKQINSDTARIIFPGGMEKEAGRVAAIVGALNSTTVSTIGPVSRKINIVFRNQTTISNGYVQLAPFRSEFELTPSQNSFELGSIPWYQFLAIHEYRHVQQINNFRVGLSKLFFYLFGQEGLDLANNLTVPNWFYEGDAVFQETFVSRQGRGRLPFFLNSYQSLWVSEKNYSWMKLRNGSLRDYVPDHYPLGFMMVSYGRENFGPDFWKQTTHDAAAFKGLFYPLQKSVQQHAGISYERFRSDALKYFKKQLPDSAYQDADALNAKAHKHFQADQEFPAFTDSLHLLYVKSSYKKPHAFFLQNINTKEEEKLETRAVSLDNQYSYNNGKIVYSAYEPDIRWGWKDYSVIRVFDLAGRSDKSITSKTKYFAPDISADGLRIVAVSLDPEERSSLHILDAKTGKVQKILNNPGHLFYTYPKFYNDSTILSAARNNKGEMALCLVSVYTGQINLLTPFSMQVIGFPAVHDRDIYFSASRDGQDRLFMIRDQVIYSLGSPDRQATGSYQPTYAYGKLAWTHYTSTGYRIHTQTSDLSPVGSIPFDQWAQPLETHFLHSLDHPPFVLSDTVFNADHAVKKYSPLFRLFNFHSWRPYIDDPDYTFSLVGENILNTMQTDIYAGYNRNEGYTKVGADAIYGGLFPYIDAGMQYLIGRNAYFRGNPVYWNEMQVNAGASIPLNLSKGQWYTSLQPGANLIYHQTYFRGAYKDSFDTRGYASVDPYLIFSNQTQAGQQQIFPSFAQSVNISYDRAITTLKGNQWLASGYFYFPGFASSNSLVIGAAYQSRDSLNQIRFSNSFPFSRGYSGESFYRMYRLSANYHIPLVYPDWGFGGIIYFLRIRANLFYDYTGVPSFATNGPYVFNQYRSFGTEIYFDTKWWNELPISFGIRYSHLLDRDYEGRSPNQWELILPLNLLGR